MRHAKRRVGGLEEHVLGDFSHVDLDKLIIIWCDEYHMLAPRRRARSVCQLGVLVKADHAEKVTTLDPTPFHIYVAQPIADARWRPSPLIEALRTNVLAAAEGALGPPVFTKMKVWGCQTASDALLVTSTFQLQQGYIHRTPSSTTRVFPSQAN